MCLFHLLLLFYLLRCSFLYWWHNHIRLWGSFGSLSSCLTQDKHNKVVEYLVHRATIVRQQYFDQTGFLFNLVNQPARSPDMNIFDLSVWNVLQYLSWQYNGHLRNIEDVLNAFHHSWDQFCHTQLEKSFCILQTVFDKVIKCQGGSC